MAFNGSSNHTFHGGQFTNFEGTVHFHANSLGTILLPEFTSPTLTLCSSCLRNLPPNFSRERMSVGGPNRNRPSQTVNTNKERMIWDEYTRIPIGKIHIKRSVGNTQVREQDAENRSWRHLVAYRTFNHIRIQDHGNSDFLYVTYRGQDASEAFHMDFKQFSHVRNLNVAQLLGYNDTLPALIFYDVARIWERNKFSSLLYIYFEYVFGEVCISDREMDLRKLWINPRTGALCTGPFVQYSFDNSITYSASGFKTNSASSRKPSLLSLQAYKDSSTLFTYLTQRLPAQDIIQGIDWSRRGTLERVADEEMSFMLSSLPGTIYRGTQHTIVARWVGDMKECYYKPVCKGNSPDEMWLVCIAHNSVRIKTMQSHISHLHNQEFGIYYALHPREEWCKLADSWLLQAHSVLSQYGLREAEWKEHFIAHGFWLYLQCSHEHSSRRSSNTSTKPVYLFTQPIPHPSDGEGVWNTWVKGKKYFWSFHPSGDEEISEDMQLSLGLPSFTSRLEIRHFWWDHNTYNAVQKLHVFNGFNPQTTAFAQSFGLPNFKDIPESPQNTEAMDVDDEPLASSTSVIAEGDAMNVD
uniref:Uncharacterized protein n=1 Tax=Moniliophthora roreri TaxID=221103 RepID=A0A0W0EYV2_MONRR